MSVHRLSNIPGFSIDRVAAAAGSDPDVLRMENLDTDLPPPQAAIEATQKSVLLDDANSYLPFTGTRELRTAVVNHLFKTSGQKYNSDTEAVITCGATEGMLDALLATTDPDDEVILTDPTYAGMTNRVRLAGAIPKLVPFVFVILNQSPERSEGEAKSRKDKRSEESTRRMDSSSRLESSGTQNDKIQHAASWRLDLDALRSAITTRTRAMFIMNPSMPSGAVLNQDEWNEIASLCRKQNLWLIYNAAMERILYDGVPFIHPATLREMRERTIILGSVSKEFRMIGWRIGWAVGPASIMSDVAKVHIYNVVTPTGIAQAGAAAALASPEDDFKKCLDEWHRRRDEMMKQLEGLPYVPPHGGWSLLLDVGKMGYDSMTVSQRLLERGKIAATPMKHWGERNADQFVRFVFSNEPVGRLATLRERVTLALRGQTTR